jgi:hypothetical protein
VGNNKLAVSNSIRRTSSEKDQAIDYAHNRACFRSGQIRVLDSSGNVERTIAFDESNRKL